jgi:cell division protease FtsH
VGQVFSPNQIQASFDTIFGAQDAKLALQEVIDIFNNHAQYAQYHIPIPNGILLHGPSGNGKTMLAKAFAGQAGMSFIYVNAAEFESAGHGVDRVKELFEAARQFSPCAVFIDGIDSVGARIKDSGNNKNAMVNQLLAELDGFLGKDPKKPMTVIAATNNLEVLDPALLRPGRFDRVVYVGNPTEQDRQNILQAGCADKPCDIIDFAFLAKQSEGLSAAQVQNWIVQTNTVAAKKRSMITTDLFMQIFDQIK